MYANSRPAIWYANQFNVGDNELDSLGRKITEIVGMEKFDVSAEKQALYLDINIKSGYDTRTKTYFVKGKNITYGTPLTFNLRNVTFSGIITEFPNMNKSDVKIRTAVIQAIGERLEPIIVNSVHTGDKIYDSNGTLLAEIIKAEVKPSKTITTDNYGNLLLKDNPIFRDLIVTARVRTKTVKSNNFIFDQDIIKIGETLPLNFNNISVFLMITGFEFVD